MVVGALAKLDDNVDACIQAHSVIPLTDDTSRRQLWQAELQHFHAVLNGPTSLNANVNVPAW